jgi:hypothetical protein
MQLPPLDDAVRPVYLAVRSLRLLGVLFILLGLVTPALAIKRGHSPTALPPAVIVTALSHAVPGVLYMLSAALLLRGRRTAVFALIGGFVAAYLFVGTSSFSRLVNLPYQERYFIPVIPCVAIALADVLERWRGGPRASWLAALAVVCFLGGVVGAGARSGRLYFTEGMRNAAIAVNALPNDGRPVMAASQIRWGVIQYLTPRAASRVHDATDYPKGTPGYYLTVLRNGAPAIADSNVTPNVLGEAYLSVAVDQRRKRLWSLDGARAQDSAVVYIMGTR